jgi:hypothetical protein
MPRDGAPQAEFYKRFDILNRWDNWKRYHLVDYFNEKYNVMPAAAGIQKGLLTAGMQALDSRLCGNDTVNQLL